MSAGAIDGGRTRRVTSTIIITAIAVAGVLSLFASASPDSLESVAAQVGFDSAAGTHALANSPLADYSVKGLDQAWLSGGLAGVLGVALTGLIAFGVLRIATSHSTEY